MTKGILGKCIKWDKSLNTKNEFKNEKEYQDYIENNIDFFTRDVLELGDYVSHETNKAIRVQNFGGTKERVDLIIQGTEKTALVELKYPKNDFQELRNCIGQSLNYIVTAENNFFAFDKMCVVSPVYDQRIFDIITRFKLPIELYYLTKEVNSRIDIQWEDLK
jgi:hypothetical protein